MRPTHASASSCGVPLRRSGAVSSILARIAFLLAVAFFVYLAWRERRGEISEWSARARTAFYGAAILIVVDIGVFTFAGASGLDAVAFVLVLGLCGYAMWRTWRQEHTYS